MAIEFLVESGEGLENATSYLSVEDLKQYFENMGYSYGTLTDDELKVRLNKSTKVLDASYLTCFNDNGWRSDSDQALEWPRTGATYIDGNLINSNVVPPEIEDATAEYVYAIISGNTIQGTTSSTGIKKSEAVKVDVIETRDEYFEGSDSYRDTITAVDDALSRICGGTSANNQYTIVRV